MQSLKSERAKKEYEQFVKEVTPKQNLFRNMAKAFIVGGLICVVGQILLHIGKTQFSLSKDDAGSWCSLILILSSVILTGLNIYQKIVTFAGCGALVPITGFANSVAAPAIEYKKEGQVFGIGAKIFTIAGPVILYGVLQAGCSAFSIGCGPLPGTGFKSVPQRFRLFFCAALAAVTGFFIAVVQPSHAVAGKLVSLFQLRRGFGSGRLVFSGFFDRFFILPADTHIRGEIALFLFPPPRQLFPFVVSLMQEENFVLFIL